MADNQVSLVSLNSAASLGAAEPVGGQSSALQALVDILSRREPGRRNDTGCEPCGGSGVKGRGLCELCRGSGPC